MRRGPGDAVLTEKTKGIQMKVGVRGRMGAFRA